MSIQQSINQMIGTASTIGTIAAQPKIQQRAAEKKANEELSRSIELETRELEKDRTKQEGLLTGYVEKSAEQQPTLEEKAQFTSEMADVYASQVERRQNLVDLAKKQYISGAGSLENVEELEKTLATPKFLAGQYAKERDIYKEQLKKAEQTRQNRMDAQKTRREREAAYFDDLKEAGVSEDYIKANRKELLKQAK